MINYYYPRTVRAITVALTDMLNDIRVVKYDKDLNAIDERNVPVTFGPTEKYHKDRKEDHYFDSDGVEHNSRSYLQLPRIALIPNGIVYDSTRAMGANEWRYWIKESLGLNDSDIDEVFSDYQPTPYNFNFTVYIKNDSMDTLSQILEQILPYFNPTLMLRVKEFSFLNIERDIPVILDAVGYEFSDDMNATDTRFVNASMNFTVKGFMYRPVITSKIIKKIESKYINNNDIEIEGFLTTGVETKDGVILDPSEVPQTFITSGSYQSDTKEYNYYKDTLNNP